LAYDGLEEKQEREVSTISGAERPSDDDAGGDECGLAVEAGGD
jgi:hypothetical protein